jgi:hypothetical protein
MPLKKLRELFIVSSYVCLRKSPSGVSDNAPAEEILAASE